MSENKDQSKPGNKPDDATVKGAKTAPTKATKAKSASTSKSKAGSSQKPKSPSKTTAAALVKEKPAASGRGLAWLAILLIIIAVVLAYWWEMGNQQSINQALLASKNDNQRLQAEIINLKQSIETLGGKVSSEDLIQPKLDQLGSRIDALVSVQSSNEDNKQALQTRLSSLEQVFAGIDDRQQITENTLSGLALNQQATDRDVILAEVAFLVRSAAQRLELFDDKAAAIDLLQLADQQLGSIKMRQFAPLRQRIEEDLLALGMIQAPDIVTLTGKLLALEKSVDNWQTRLPERKQEAGEGSPASDSGWVDKLKYLLNSLVTVRQDQASFDFLTLEQSDRLKDRIRLELQAARIAAMASREDQYQASLSRVNNWIMEHFDPAAAENAAALNQLTDLQQIVLNPVWPNLNPLLALLQQLEGLATSSSAETEEPL